jgi:hypothetical protein
MIYRKMNIRYMNTGIDFFYFPKNESKLSRFTNWYPQHLIERLGYLIGIVLAHQGYSGFKQFRAGDLRTILGKDYINILADAHKSKWVTVDILPSNYDSLTNKKGHRSIRVIGWKGAFRKLMVGETRAKQAISKFREGKLKHSDELYHNALLNVYRNTCNSRVLKKGFGEINRHLKSGLHFPNIDPFGRRIHSFITYGIERGNRPYVKPIGHFREDVVEVDIKSSHPSLLFDLGSDPACLEHAFEEEKVIEAFYQILSNIQFQEQMLLEFKYSLEEGRFYETFWKECLDESFRNWREFGLKKYYLHNKTQQQLDERTILKFLFMLVVNGGAKKCLDAISTSTNYASLGRLILIYNHEFRIPWLLEGIQDFNKPYWPRKNLSLTLQRIESKSMILTLNKLEEIWCLPIHDGILCLHKDASEVQDAMMKSSHQLGLNQPIVSIK